MVSLAWPELVHHLRPVSIHQLQVYCLDQPAISNSCFKLDLFVHPPLIVIIGIGAHIILLPESEVFHQTSV